MVGIILGNLAMAVLHEGRSEQSEALHIEEITLGQELKNKLLIAWGLDGLAWVAEGRGQAERAARLMGAAEALLESHSARLTPFRRAMHDRTMAATCASLGEAAFAAAWAEGRAMPLEQALAEALDAKRA